MFLDGMSFLEEEREAWRPYEALTDLSDEQLAVPVAAAHGWSGADLMAHMLAWLEVSLEMARELAVGESSPTLARIDAEWEAKGDGLNDELLETYLALPREELRRRYATSPGELRGFLTVVPETRWVKHPQHMESLVAETLEHYEEHLPDLEAILATSR
ncbi:MAG TPA: hypothetical protein VLA23_12640 [Candidatus Limnocylindrales bacterium]|nr:hypothetical protein [Candidatus Limnocylindrales bacterium]